MSQREMFPVPWAPKPMSPLEEKRIAEETAILSALPDYRDGGGVCEIEPEDEAAVRRLERKGLVMVKRWRDDQIDLRLTMYAGRLCEVKDG